MSTEVDVDNASLAQLKEVLINPKSQLANRFRALFNLKNIGLDGGADAHTAIDYIADAFADDLELLKHEVAYVLGQIKDVYAAPRLQAVLEDNNQQCMVRHEAAEALGAIGDEGSLKLLQHYYENDPLEEIRQTCELAIERIKWEHSERAKTEHLEQLAYTLIDPAPPMELTKELKVPKLQEILNDQLKPLFERYRAMFRLRDLNTDEAALALASGLDDPLALFKHEIAYVFGQLLNPVTVPALVKVLGDSLEAPMVRHEAAEALGLIATDEVLPILQKFAQDDEQVVRELAIVALDMYEYENSGELEYAVKA